MFVTLVPTRFFASYLASVEKNVKKYGNFYEFPFLVLFLIDMYCVNILIKLAEILAVLFFYVVSKKYNPA